MILDDPPKIGLVNQEDEHDELKEGLLNESHDSHHGVMKHPNEEESDDESEVSPIARPD